MVLLASSELATDLSTSATASMGLNVAFDVNALSWELISLKVAFKVFWCDTTEFNVRSAVATRDPADTMPTPA